MLNLELPGVSLFKFGCFPDWSFFSASPVATRYVSPFYAASKGVVRSKSKFSENRNGLNTTRRVEIFRKRQPELEPATSTFTFAAQKAKLRGDRGQK